jgi:phosphopentomutase
MENSTVDYHGKSSDADILIDAKQRISEDYPAVFCIFDDVDHNGHRTGFDPDNSQYMDALKETDAKAKELISTVESRDNED